MTSVFDKQKHSALAGHDFSKKGSIDEPIVPLIQYLNEHNDYFTTSSCSGRIIVIDDQQTCSHELKIAAKKGCKWLYTSHMKVEPDDIPSALTTGPIGTAVFKYEPFVLHVQCRTLDHAQKMLQFAVSSGFRNSGISAGNKGKIMVGVRCTHGLEVPLSENNELLVSNRYIKYISDIANKKMEENFHRIERFFKSIQVTLSDSGDKEPQKTKEKRKHTNKESEVQNRKSTEEVSICNSVTNIDDFWSSEMFTESDP